ncbi:hypothetical protein G6011_04678 [Alternaria panax]|uniref:Uncharacterized protein n=1 Tax=Alternaria panax TaxID=48097 RepID=A0AAD4IGZ1_9PLEO|nr:hypothetical protein G6011_04678 [Alternaria panax]
MDRPSPTRSFKGSPLHDSAIGTPRTSGSSQTSPPTPKNTDPLQAQQTQAKQGPSPFNYATAARRQRIEQDSAGSEVVRRVLSLPRGRRTPSLRNAPDLQWDLSGQPPPRCSNLDEPESMASADNIPRREHANFSRPNPMQYSYTPLPPRIRDPPAEYQPFGQRPLDKSPDLRPQRYPGELKGHPAHSPLRSYGSMSSRATYSAEDEDPSLSTARLLPVTRVTPKDIRPSEMAIAGRQLEPLLARTRSFETPEQEQMQHVEQVQERADRHRHLFRLGMRTMWRKVRAFFDF